MVICFITVGTQELFDLYGQMKFLKPLNNACTLVEIIGRHLKEYNHSSCFPPGQPLFSHPHTKKA